LEVVVWGMSGQTVLFHTFSTMQEPTIPTTDAPSQQSRSAGDKPTLCFFFSSKSGPCRRVEAFLAQVLQRRQNHKTFALRRVDCDERPDLAERFRVTTVPTLVVIESRKIRTRLEGPCGCREIEHLLEPWLGAESERLPVTGPQSVSPSQSAHAALAEVLDERGSASSVGLDLPAGLAFDRWQAIGRKIGDVADASTWWLADWAAYGEGNYGEKYRQAIRVTGFGYQTLRNYVWVARRFDASRRRDDLSFAHHAEVAALEESEREEWLDRAQQNNWSRNELRAQLKRALEVTAGSGVQHVRLAIDTERVERWRAAAAADGLELGDWLAVLADQAALRAAS
jgi:hypothetical protein